jgi:dCMP deaminase
MNSPAASLPSWDETFIETAKVWSKRSKDPNTKIGACIAGPDNEVVSTGYNSFPRGINDNVPERKKRPEKYRWYEHSERNAIYQAARIGISLKGCRIYLSCWVPCTDCARAIIQVGIKEVILGQKVEDASRTKWIEEAKRSTIMFEEAGVKVRVYEGA